METSPKKQLTREDIERIMALPRRTIKIGSESKSGYYDEAANLIYQCKEDGSLTGKTFTIRMPATPPPQAAEATPEKEQEEKESKKGGGKGKIFRIVGTVILVAAALMMVIPQFLPKDDPGFIPGPAESSVPGTVQVIKTTHALIPGQQISMADFEAVEMSNTTYDQFSMFARDLCLWSRADQLVGGYVKEYMPDGHYVELRDIDSSAPVTTSPWSGVSSMTWKVPLLGADKDAAISFGSKLDILVRKTIRTQVAAGGSESSAIEETSRIETYSLNGVSVIDVLNESGVSIYASYKSYAGIPLSERKEYISSAMREDPLLQKQLTPCYVVVGLTEDLAEIVSQLGEANTYSVEIKSVSGMDASTTERAQCINDFAGVQNSIRDAIAYNQQLAAEEQAAIQQAINDAKKAKAESDGQ